MFTDNVRVAFVPAREANTSKYCPDCSACMPFAHAREAKARILGRRTSSPNTFAHAREAKALGRR